MPAIIARKVYKFARRGDKNCMLIYKYRVVKDICSTRQAIEMLL
jgi:hypothetical protein